MGHRGQLWGQGGISVFVALLEIQSPEESRPLKACAGWGSELATPVTSTGDSRHYLGREEDQA